jgi:hypothetical protein
MSNHLLAGVDWSKDQELQADYSAAAWLTALGAELPDLIQAFDALNLPEEETPTHPSGCARRANITKAYNSKVDSSRQRPVPVCDVCATQITTGSAWVISREIAAGAKLQRADLQFCGSGPPSEYLPGVPASRFDYDLTGMCAAGPMSPGTRVTWKNIDVCSLMRK